MAGQVLTVVGPTASGKSRLAMELALRWNGEIVSCDSMQIYRTMDIGTAKPTAQERAAVPHHMLDVAEPWENYSAARYVQQAAACVDDILRRGKLPIVTGGTGLYRDALLAGREFAAFSGAWRQRLEERAAGGELPQLYRQLQQVDPQQAQRLHPADAKRIIRALEVWYETGQTITEHDEASRRQPPRYRAVSIGLRFENREDMWEQIDRRVDQMMEQGLVREVSALLERGVPEDCTAMQAIGYKEMAAALRQGRPPEQAAEEIKLRTRQYAKRQLTWFRRDESIRWFQWKKTPNFEEALVFSTKIMGEFGVI
ncbi:MAG: tRNA (adenosine(37)-N6)-dimethylallyltransferase MiaA [Oscillospiraceae bacterium]|nr:tRNA (adenosine(37)-N6)-dimethylallyltransferase MiaA [Oscillospiraceae bacterium]